MTGWRGLLRAASTCPDAGNATQEPAAPLPPPFQPHRAGEGQGLQPSPAAWHCKNTLGAGRRTHTAPRTPQTVRFAAAARDQTSPAPSQGKGLPQEAGEARPHSGLSFRARGEPGSWDRQFSGNQRPNLPRGGSQQRGLAFRYSRRRLGSPWVRQSLAARGSLRCHPPPSSQARFIQKKETVLFIKCKNLASYRLGN